MIGARSFHFAYYGRFFPPLRAEAVQPSQNKQSRGLRWQGIFEPGPLVRVCGLVCARLRPCAVLGPCQGKYFRITLETQGILASLRGHVTVFQLYEQGLCFLLQFLTGFENNRLLSVFPEVFGMLIGRPHCVPSARALHSPLWTSFRSGSREWVARTQDSSAHLAKALAVFEIPPPPPPGQPHLWLPAANSSAHFAVGKRMASSSKTYLSPGSSTH